MANDREFSRTDDRKSTSGPADLARALGAPSQVMTPTRKPGQVRTWPVPVRRGTTP